MKNIGVLFFVFTFFSITTLAEEVTISIKGVRNTKGKLRIGIFKDQASFEKETPFRSIELSKSGLFKGTLKCTIDLPKGEYGFALLDDENNNEEMDKSFLGIPQEGYGFSNYEHSGIFAPVFEDFKFLVRKGANLVKMRLKYL